MSKKKTTKDWWQDRIEDLKGKTDETKILFKKHAENPEKIKEQENFGEWTFLKLLSLAYCLDICTNIAKEHFKKIFYIDICAGGGFVKIKRIDEIIAGSALLGEIAPKESKKFDKIILVEKDPRKCLKLEELLPNAEVICDDANNISVLRKIEDIIGHEKNYYCFTFIDPYALTIKWNTIEFLLKIKGDLIINYMNSAVSRRFGVAFSDNVTENEKLAATKQIEEFFGEKIGETISEDSSSNYLFELYQSNIRKYKEITLPIKVEGLGGGYSYYMIFTTRKTSGEQGWIKPISQLREKVESANDKLTQKWFQIYSGKQKTLERFINKKPK